MKKDSCKRVRACFLVFMILLMAAGCGIIGTENAGEDENSESTPETSQSAPSESSGESSESGLPKDADVETGTASESNSHQDELDGIKTPAICDEIAADFSAHGWENITVMHGSVSSRDLWHVILDTTYGAEESHIYTIIGDIGEEYIQYDNGIHVVGIVTFDDETGEWIKQPVFYISDGGEDLNQQYRDNCAKNGRTFNREYTSPDETLYVDDEILPFYMYYY